MTEACADEGVAWASEVLEKYLYSKMFLPELRESRVRGKMRISMITSKFCLHPCIQTGYIVV